MKGLLFYRLSKLNSRNKRRHQTVDESFFSDQKLSKAKSCSDIGLLDTNVFQRCLGFYSSVAEFLLRQMTHVPNGDGSTSCLTVTPVDLQVSVIKRFCFVKIFSLTE